MIYGMFQTVDLDDYLTDPILSHDGEEVLVVTVTFKS